MTGDSFQPADTFIEGKCFNRENSCQHGFLQCSLYQVQRQQPGLKGLPWMQNYTALPFPLMLSLKTWRISRETEQSSGNCTADASVQEGSRSTELLQLSDMFKLQVLESPQLFQERGLVLPLPCQGAGFFDSYLAFGGNFISRLCKETGWVMMVYTSPKRVEGLFSYHLGCSITFHSATK